MKNKEFPSIQGMWNLHILLLLTMGLLVFNHMATYSYKRGLEMKCLSRQPHTHIGLFPNERKKENGFRVILGCLSQPEKS